LDRKIDLSLGQLPLPVLLYFIALAVPVHFHAGPLFLTSVRVVLLVTILPLLINLLRGRYGPLLLTDILFILFTVWIGIALSQNNPEMVVKQMGSTGVEFLGGYVLGRAYIRSENAFAAMTKLILVVICLTMPFAIFEALTGRPPIIELIRKLPGITSEVIVWIEPRMGFERVQAIFAHPIHYGLFCSSAFSLVLVGFGDVYGFGKRLLTVSIVAFCGVLSLSSGALLSLILQFFLILWAWSFSRVTGRWLMLLALFALAYVVVDLLSNRTPIRVFMSYATFSAHNAYWRGIIFEWGMKNVWMNPIFGLGFRDWIRPWYMYSGSMDNFWLVMAVRYGIPGFLLVTTGYIWALWKIGRRNLENSARLLNFRRGWMIMFVGLTFTLTTVHIWTAMYSFVFFMFGSGMWFITVQPDKDVQPAGTGTRKYRPPNTYNRRSQNPEAETEEPGPFPPNRPALPFSRFPPKS